MFSRLAAALSNAVDALAPPLPLQEELLWHWTAITKFYTDRNSNSKRPIELTGLPGRLEQMSKILEQEESELGVDTMGPCMEYFLQHQMLDQMSAMSRADTPPGIKRCVLVFVTRLLSTSQQPLLPQMGVANAVHKLIGLCGEVLAAPTEREEVGCFYVGLLLFVPRLGTSCYTSAAVSPGAILHARAHHSIRNTCLEVVVTSNR